MLLAVTTTDLIASVSTLSGGVIALAVVLGRTRERLVKLEEWIRLHEKQEEKRP